MLMNISKIIYVLVALTLVTATVYGKLFVFKKKKPQFVSDYAAYMAGVLGLYSILSLLFVWLFPDLHSKGIMFFFALSPFLIGLLATYHTEKYYTVLQVLLFLLSAGYVIL